MADLKRRILHIFNGPGIISLPDRCYMLFLTCFDLLLVSSFFNNYQSESTEVCQSTTD